MFAFVFYVLNSQLAVRDPSWVGMCSVKQLVLMLLSLKGCVALELNIVFSGGSTTLNSPLPLPGMYWTFSQASSSSPVHHKGIQFVPFEKILWLGVVN